MFILKARAVPKVRVFMFIKLIDANLTKATHAEVVELEGPGEIPPELLAVHFVILAREL